MELASRPTPASHGLLSTSPTPFPTPASGLDASEQGGEGRNHAESDARWSTTVEAPRRATPPLRNVYELWPQVGGRNQFHCAGRCVTGPPHDNGYNMCAWVFIVVPVLFYYTFCAEYLYEQVSPLLPAVTGVALVSSLSFMLLTSCTDPGIIPRHGLQLSVPGLADRVANAIGSEPLFVDPMTAEPICMLTEKQAAEGYRWCTTCKVVRPPRASHCRDCDNCVMRFDHHCPFVNNCIGQRNYAFFAGFIVSTSCLGLAVLSGIFIFTSHLTEEHHEDDPQPVSPEAIHVLVALIGVPCAVLLVGVLGLSAFHTYLVLSGRTTKEALTGNTSMPGGTLSMARGPSLVQFRFRLRDPLVCL